MTLLVRNGAAAEVPFLIATWAIEKPYEIILAWVWAFRDTDTAKTEARLPVTSPSEYSYTENRLIIDAPPGSIDV